MIFERRDLPALLLVMVTTSLAGACRSSAPAEPVRPLPAVVDAGARPVARPAEAGVEVPTGTLVGVVRLTGPLPRAMPIAIDSATAGRPGCSEAAREWYGNAFPIRAPGPLPWAVVTADGHSTDVPPPRNRYANYHDCHISPPVLVMSLNDRLLLHAETSAHHLPKVDGLGASIAQMLNVGEDQEKHLVRPGRYILHSVTSPLWMQTPLLVTPNWFYDQTDSEGRFRIARVPAGTVTVHAWYPGARQVDVTVTVRAGETVTQDFALSALPEGEIRAMRQPLTAPRDAGAVIP